MVFIRTILTIIFLGTLILAAGCGSEKSGTESTDISSELIEKLDSVQPEPKAIFYHMLLPVEMAHLFEQVGANYYPDMLNPATDLSRYNTQIKLALNIGVYGVDLSYVKMFERQEGSVNYLAAIHRLSEDLGIPGDMYKDILTNLEDYVSNKDSLARVTVELYKSVDEYLQESGKKSASALIMMGGWVESMYVATQIFEKDQGNIKLMEKIAEQKYSLNSLISLMNNYQADPEMTEYLLMLKNLRRSFDKFQIYYKKDDVSVDTVSKTISASRYYIDASPDQVLEIGSKIYNLRTKIIK